MEGMSRNKSAEYGLTTYSALHESERTRIALRKLRFIRKCWATFRFYTTYRV
jgi:hypothetical protein